MLCCFCNVMIYHVSVIAYRNNQKNLQRLAVGFLKLLVIQNCVSHNLANLRAGYLAGSHPLLLM